MVTTHCPGHSRLQTCCRGQGAAGPAAVPNAPVPGRLCPLAPTGDGSCTPPAAAPSLAGAPPVCYSQNLPDRPGGGCKLTLTHQRCPEHPGGAGCSATPRDPQPRPFRQGNCLCLNICLRLQGMPHRAQPSAAHTAAALALGARPVLQEHPVSQLPTPGNCAKQLFF